MAHWAHLALTLGDITHPDYAGPITRDDLNFMWDTYIAGEYGGANEVFAELHALTGDARHLETAKCFDNRESLFDACVENRDILVCAPGTQPGRRRPARLHANTHVPNFTGYMRIFERTGEREYRQAARNFFGMVVPHRMYAHGGTSGNFPGSNNNVEQFQNRDNIANSIAANGAETCTTYNLLKLARNLFFHEQDPAYMDYYERGLVNQIAGSRADNDTTSNPQVTYFQPLTPGVRRDYGNTGTCCGGTGMENHTKYQESIYFRSADASTLWVNLYISSTLDWEEKGFTITQETDYPREQRTRLTVNGRGRLRIKLRVPGWVENGFLVRINGVEQRVKARPGTDPTLDRRWRRGSYRELTLYRDLKRDGDYSRAAITPVDGRDFTTHGLTLRPHYVGDTLPHSPYFRRVEPEIVFGSIATGVPNHKRNDGLPEYDVPVERIPSPGTDGLTFLDVVWDEAPFATHGDFVETVRRTARDFGEAGLLTGEEKRRIVAAAVRARQELEP
jgi:uncharacterized protein